ncbi:hypothetical protein PM10SUCC1_15900 [Propionigenium maris DSM 9537]|uniref:Porin n=2 Tax=Propionigenium TaxID=2332 RepID=A0A9W6GLT2_9FUSO|nr:hypothetical protein PM10SUCC1_15900 [Propionigenium maris DSM 9537]
MMKRLLIALGALTMVGTAVAAAEEFRPTGSIKQEVRWYSDKEDIDSEHIRFTLAEGGVRFTENFYIDYRVRDYIRNHSDEGSNTKDMRTRLYYDHGYLGDTQIDVRQRLEVRSTQSYNRFSYTPEFNFAEYVPGFSTFKVRPVARYQDDNNGNTTLVRTGADLLTYLPVYSEGNIDFGVEFNTYFRYDETKGPNRYYTSGGSQKDSQTAVDIELYTYFTYDLGTWNGVNFAFYHELGVDPYTFYDRKIDVTDADGNRTGDSYDSDLYLYNDFEIQFSYNVNDSTSIYGALAVEFANQQAYGNDGDTGNYKWQAYPYIGWRTKF